MASESKLPVDISHDINQFPKDKLRHADVQEKNQLPSKEGIHLINIHFFDLGRIKKSFDTFIKSNLCYLLFNLHFTQKVIL